jgi:hypothetical protein
MSTAVWRSIASIQASIVSKSVAATADRLFEVSRDSPVAERLEPRLERRELERLDLGERQMVRGAAVAFEMHRRIVSEHRHDSVPPGEPVRKPGPATR